jgi:hypothetical protein
LMEGTLDGVDDVAVAVVVLIGRHFSLISWEEGGPEVSGSSA